ncbi:MAG: heavy metal translocating P-type ATPase [Butyrivibrio sp.]|nr:heavy metal translocating P-type ATPase [Butyrivibrio sp.]
MTKKQKKVRNRIIITLIIFVALLVLEWFGILDLVPWYARLCIFLVPYAIIGYDVIRKAVINITHGQIFDENFLMMIATFGAFGIGEYSEALAVMLFYQIGELFQSVAVGKSRQSISDLMSLAPEYANLVQEDGTISEVDPEEVRPGDIILVKAGEKIPLDGIVVEGESFIDTAALTGESVPRKVREKEDVISGCLNGEGVLKVKVTKAYEDSTVSRILELVENASNKKSKMENFITRFAKYYTPVVTICAVLLAALPPLFTSLTYPDSIRRACIFLIVSCPCALVISVPLGFFGGIGASSKKGVLVKGSNFLEAAALIDTVVFDKTGTITKGEFKVSEIVPSTSLDITQEELLGLAAYGELFSNHPIAVSILQCYSEQHFGQMPDPSHVDEKMTKEIAGKGVRTMLAGKELLVGNDKFIKVPASISLLDESAGTVVYVQYDGTYAGCIIIADSIKDGVKAGIQGLYTLGIKRTIMLTGDNKDIAQHVADQVGINDVMAQLLPADKVDAVEKLLTKEDNKMRLAFVGDGINDAPVLTRADVGIAMGSLGSDAAIEAADIVIMDDDIRKICDVIRIARKTVMIVKENIVFALAVKLIILVLGALGLTTMWLAVFGDVGVAVLAILNSMRTLSEPGTSGNK